MAVLVLVALAIVGPAQSFRAQDQELGSRSDMAVPKSGSRIGVELIYHPLSILSLSQRVLNAALQEHLRPMVKSNMNDSEIMSFPGLGGLADAMEDMHNKFVEGVQVGIKAYAATHHGACPESIFQAVPNYKNDGSGFDYGIGCHLPDTCHCPMSPLMVCATATRWSDPGAATKQFINQFGYCRTGAWVFITAGILAVGIVAGGVYLLKK